jgi:cytochrome c oxidase assembly protein subunit 15
VVLAAMVVLGWRLWRCGEPALRPFALGISGLAAWQLASGLSNVVLGWPIVAALAHTGGAGLAIALLTALLVRGRRAGFALPERTATAAA